MVEIGKTSSVRKLPHTEGLACGKADFLVELARDGMLDGGWNNTR